jgi:hypothetical protein
VLDGIPTKRLRRAEIDPMALLVNVFDCGLVFALALFLAAKDPAGAQEKDPVPENRQELSTYSATQEPLSGNGQRLGIAYQLPSGEVVYVPDLDAAKK